MSSLDYARLADLYDSYCLYEQDVPLFEEAARQSEGPILELMAGTGRISVPLLRQGASLVCVDREPAMLGVLANKIGSVSERALLVCADVTSMPLRNSFQLAILPFQGFSELTLDVEQRAVLFEVHRLLASGGRFICTLHNPAFRLRSIDGVWHEFDPHECPQGGAVSVRIRASFDSKTRVASGVQEVRRLDAEGRCVETRDVPLRCSLVDRDGFLGLASFVGYEVQALYGDYPREPYDGNSSPYMIWVLQKAA